MARSDGAGSAVAGLLFRGPFLGWEFGQPSAGDSRPPLGTLRLEARRFDGEPYWFKAWFKPEFAQQLSGLVVGEWVEVVVSPSVKGNRVSWRADGISRLAAVPQSLADAS